MSPSRRILQLIISQLARCRLRHNTRADVDDHRDHLGQEAEHNAECKGTVVQGERSFLCTQDDKSVQDADTNEDEGEADGGDQLVLGAVNFALPHAGFG